MISLIFALTCEFSQNGARLWQRTVEINSDEKIFVGEAPDARAFITRKSDRLFSLEVFVADQEERVYAEGVLRDQGDSLAATVWSRSALIEVKCSK